MVTIKIMKKYIILALSIFLHLSTWAQKDTTKPASRQIYPEDRHDNKAILIVAGSVLVLFEGALMGISSYASKPNINGDKVVGYTHATAAASIFAIGMCRVLKNKNDNTTKQQVVKAMVYSATSAGFYLLAKYNLKNAALKNHTKKIRFWNNFKGQNLALFAPLILNIIGVSRENTLLNKVTNSIFVNDNQIGLKFKL
jgi:hypothetical protein